MKSWTSQTCVVGWVVEVHGKESSIRNGQRLGNEVVRDELLHGPWLRRRKHDWPIVVRDGRRRSPNNFPRLQRFTDALPTVPTRHQQTSGRKKAKKYMCIQPSASDDSFLPQEDPRIDRQSPQNISPRHSSTAGVPLFSIPIPDFFRHFGGRTLAKMIASRGGL